MTTLDLKQFSARPLSAGDYHAIVEKAVNNVMTGMDTGALASLDVVVPKSQLEINQVIGSMRLSVDEATLDRLLMQVAGQVTGFGFLLPLFRRSDLTDILINPNGSLFVRRKGEKFNELVTTNLVPEEVNRAVEATLRESVRAVNEATPSVDAKLRHIDNPEFPALHGGARIKVLHPVIAPSVARNACHSVTIRLFEPKPVLPEQLVAWQVAPQAVIDGLLELVAKEARLLVIGGTGSGKTTTLSALSNGIPARARVVKIEDPMEIWLDAEKHPDQVTIEPRPVAAGQSIAPYTLANGVDDAMRMNPHWLIVGEVRDGRAALALFRAQMSDHPGLSTFHSYSPKAAVERFLNIMRSDAGIDPASVKSTFAEAVDIVVQVGWSRKAGRRILFGVWAVDKKLAGGDVKFEQLYKPGDGKLAPYTDWRNIDVD
jgi:pilus assembly protein CpaF